ncbi:MAG: hypothetical protein ACREGJ_04980 [Candidatus Saccharimonadales bacterium]
MSKKSRKKRDKPYRGADAANQQPVVHRYSAKVRSPLGEWWHERKRTIKLIAISAGVVLAVGYLLFELFRLIF